MSNHTKAPWLFDGKVVYALNEKGVNIFSAFVQDGKTGEDELKANARRIVACVNACEGISTEMLESVQINPSMLLSMYSRLESERTELEKRLNNLAQENMDHFSRINDLEQKLKSEMRHEYAQNTSDYRGDERRCSMNRARPADLRQALVAAHAMAENGVLFVPVPVRSREEWMELAQQSAKKMDDIVDEAEKSEV